MGFNILGTGSAVPSQIITNDMLAEIVETSDEWIKKRTGISERRICTTETLTELSGLAAKRALENAGVRADELDLIICTTLRGDYITPSQGALVQREIAASCPAFDINAACSGFIFALDVAAGYFERKGYEKILVVSAEQMSSLTDWSDRSTCVLFGDGCGAVVLGRGDGLMAVTLHTEGNPDVLNVPRGEYTDMHGEKRGEPSFTKMDGKEVYKFAVSSFASGILKVTEEAKISLSDIKYIVPHQANLRIISAALARLSLPMEAAFVNIERFGNSSSSSLYIALDELSRSGKLKRGDIIALTAFGGGLSCGTALVRW